MFPLNACAVINAGSKNFAINAINFANAKIQTMHTDDYIVKTHEVLKYDLTETSLISNLDSYNEHHTI